jgi:multiple antibiotic resistance protein
LLVLLIVSRFGGERKGGFIQDTITRFMGLVVLAMGVQFAITGIKSFFAG